MTANEINPVAFSYGYDCVRFIRPVFIDDTRTVKATITEKRDYGYLIELVEINNQDAQIVLACQHLFLVQRKEASQSP